MSELQPADPSAADYRTLLLRLTSLDRRAAGLRSEAEKWHGEQTTAADDAVHEAENEVGAARHAVRLARRDKEKVDADAALLWSDYVHKVGPAAERFGRNLPPASIPRQRDDRHARDYLDEVENRVKYTPKARPITFLTKVLFGVLGFAGGFLGFLGNQLLRTTGAAAAGDWHQAAPVVALLVLLACPVLAVVTAKKLADRRGASMDIAAVVTVLATGLVTALLLYTAVRYSAG
ncbi:hypothetical protein [Actinoplanes sp. NPDC051851]|uniref:hypothetical protein n=1 Tax=Actinoplanes sp. NPDC051851 TaxID=3154753 RepID=UPI0034390573